jgi:hypothetical protein
MLRIDPPTQVNLETVKGLLSSTADAIKARPVTADDVKSAKNKERIRAIERRGRIAAWNEFIGFGVSKVLGLSGLVAGGIGYVAPGLSPIALNRPAWVAGAGLALLTGKNLLALVAKVERLIK